MPIFGAIIPDPFAMPEIVILPPLELTLTLLPLGKVSVVIIARAAFSIFEREASQPDDQTRLLFFDILATHLLLPLMMRIFSQLVSALLLKALQ